MKVNDEVVVLIFELVDALGQAITQQMHPVDVWIVCHDGLVAFLCQEMHLGVQLLFEAPDHRTGEHYITYRGEAYDEYFHYD